LGSPTIDRRRAAAANVFNPASAGLFAFGTALRNHQVRRVLEAKDAGRGSSDNFCADGPPALHAYGIECLEQMIADEKSRRQGRRTSQIDGARRMLADDI
jgi:hypothetical protein